jgi:hypothetical protein
MSALEGFDLELRRVVDRLRGLPMRDVPDAATKAYATCQELLAIAKSPHALPRLADHAAADQLAVIAAECRTMNEAAVTEATAALVRLRRAL